MINGYPVHTYRTFVGSLRATGYAGHIILGIANDAPYHIVDYLTSQNVTIQYIENAEKCTYNGTKSNTEKVFDMQKTNGWKCTKEYPDYKLTWARFVHYADWLNECTQCTDGVILTDVRDAYFQRDPFVSAVIQNQQYPLMVFEEDPELDNTDWLTQTPVKSCRGIEVAKQISKTRMLCSGSTMGNREGILEYLSVMKEEFDYWKTRDECRLGGSGDDQSIHNYLYYTGRFKIAISIPYRTGPINVVGYRAARISEQAHKEAKEKGLDKVDGNFYIKNNKWQEWLPKEHGMIDPDTGLILNLDGTISAQVHQVDRFGFPNIQWVNKMKDLGWPYNRGSAKPATSEEEHEQPKLYDDGYKFLKPSDFKPLSNVKTKYLYADAEGSAKTLLNAAQTPRSIPDDIIDPVIEEERCKSYGLTYSGRKKRRRIFYGSNIADDSWHTISTHALEFYGIFHTVVFAESNRTQMHYPRTVRFGKGSESLQLLQNNMYGPNNTTNVHVEMFINEDRWPKDLGWEGMQASVIVERWKANGMTHDDIAYLSDVDEVYTRDFIRAMQICDVRQFDSHNNCEDARISACSLVFEGGPKCAVQRHSWHHPDLTIGACVEGINNEPHLHPEVVRHWPPPKHLAHKYPSSGTGWLGDGYTMRSKFSKLPKNTTHYPLFNTHDFR